MNSIIEEAIGRLDNERKHFKGDKFSQAVVDPVLKTLKSFCEDERFARVVAEGDKTLSDCMKYVTNKCGGCLSDLDAYSRAASFYFPKAKVLFKMELEIEGHSKKTDVKTDNIVTLLDLL